MKKLIVNTLLIILFGSIVAFATAKYQEATFKKTKDDLEQQAAFWVQSFKICKDITDHGTIELQWSVYGR